MMAELDHENAVTLNIELSQLPQSREFLLKALGGPLNIIMRTIIDAVTHYGTSMLRLMKGPEGTREVTSLLAYVAACPLQPRPQVINILTQLGTRVQKLIAKSYGELQTRLLGDILDTSENKNIRDYVKTLRTQEEIEKVIRYDSEVIAAIVEDDLKNVAFTEKKLKNLLSDCLSSGNFKPLTETVRFIQTAC